MGRFLVTGGCGFIGSHLVEALIARGDTVRVLDNLSTGRRSNIPTEIDLLVGDVGNRETVETAVRDIDGCFHLAAIASVEKCRLDWADAHRTNLGGMVNLLDAVRPEKTGREIPVIYASSAAVYGDNPRVPLTEEASKVPLSSYGADKLGCEMQARIGAEVHGIPSTGFRFFNVFGPRQDPESPYSGVISIFTERLLHSRKVTIFGDGEQIRDFIYVGNIVAFLLSATEVASSGAEVFNACTGEGTTINRLVEILGNLLEVEPQVEYAPPRSGDIRQSIGDPTHARAKFLVDGGHDISKGLAQTMSWIREN